MLNKLRNSNLFQWFAALSIAMLFAGAAHASGTAAADTTFDTIHTTLEGWAQGSLGKVISVATFIVGVAMGVVRQSVIAAVVGVGSAMVMYYGPGVINSIFSALI